MMTGGGVKEGYMTAPQRRCHLRPAEEPHGDKDLQTLLTFDPSAPAASFDLHPPPTRLHLKPPNVQARLV